MPSFLTSWSHNLTRKRCIPILLLKYMLKWCTREHTFYPHTWEVGKRGSAVQACLKAVSSGLCIKCLNCTPSISAQETDAVNLLNSSPAWSTESSKSASQVPILKALGEINFLDLTLDFELVTGLELTFWRMETVGVCHICYYLTQFIWCSGWSLPCVC